MEMALNSSLAQRQECKPKPLSNHAEEPLDLTVEGWAADTSFESGHATWSDAFLELHSELAVMIRDEEWGLPNAWTAARTRLIMSRELAAPAYTLRTSSCREKPSNNAAIVTCCQRKCSIVRSSCQVSLILDGMNHSLGWRLSGGPSKALISSACVIQNVQQAERP